MILLDIEIPKGNTYSQPYAVKQSGVAFDLTGYLLKFTVKTNYVEADASAVINALITVSTPLTGIFTHTLTHAQTDINPGSYVCEIKLYNASGTFIQTLGRGTFKIANVVLFHT